MPYFFSPLTKRIAVGSFSLFVLAACQQTGKPTTAKAKVETPSGVKAEQSGSVEIPAQVSSSKSSATLAVPKGSIVQFFLPDETSPGKMQVILSENSDLKLELQGEKVSLPKTFQPPALPSAIEQAKADGVKLFYWLSAGLLLLTLGLAYTQHYKGAIIAGIGAVAVPIMGNFVSEASATMVCLVALTGSVALYVAWYLLKRKAERSSPIEQT